MTYYNEIASGYNELHGEEQRKKMQIIEQILEKLKPKKQEILDVGCGTGLSTPEGATGVDPNIELLKQHPGYKEGRAILAKAEQLPFKDEQFDVVISLTAIHNFDDIEKGLQEIKRVGRRYILSVLKKANTFDKIKQLITTMFDVKETIEEDKDVIFVCY
ncbi:class I SAM-dependent methyltransferase [Candidatus Woesearchaeota archaeon]|nr:class I SAM-dependent methyltransferase [Candidatus Woesearchaeota archaeon]